MVEHGALSYSLPVPGIKGFPWQLQAILFGVAGLGAWLAVNKVKKKPTIVPRRMLVGAIFVGIPALGVGVAVNNAVLPFKERVGDLDQQPLLKKKAELGINLMYGITLAGAALGAAVGAKSGDR